MKARDALIAWSGWDDPLPERGTVRVGRFIDKGQVDWTAPYGSTSSAASIARRRMQGADRLAGLFRDFQYLVVEERLDPEDVHKAFLVIDEYAELFTPDEADQDRL